MIVGTTDYTYDANGNVLTVKDLTGTITRTYDELNRVTSYTDANGKTVKYGYDELGNLISLTYPGGEIIRYEYYKNGLLKTVTDNDGRITSYTYDGLGNMLTCTRPNNTKEICTYNDAGYIVEIKNVKNVGSEDVESINIESSDIVISDYTYTYDAVGNIVSIDGYENTDTESEISNLKSESFKYDTENRLISYNGEEVLYDADGNMIYGPVNGVMSELKYDCRNRLVSAGEISYTYDAENNRISTISGDTVEEYVVDTVSNSLSRVLVQTTHTKTGQSEKQNTEQVKERTYIYGAGLIYETEDDEIYYHHYNNLGSTMYLTDDDGEILASYTYGTYGELLSGDNTLTHYLYNGRAGVSTDDNGLYYMRKRYYNTDIKRFINSDILTGSIDNSQSLNRYSYVQGNPVSYTDPFGLSPMSGFFSGTGLAHGIFGILGCVPGPIGIAANVADALVYGIVDHDATGVTLSLLGALTMGAGSVAKLAGAGAKVTKTAKAIQYGSMFTTSGLQFALNARNTINVGKTMYDKYIVNGQNTDKNTYAEVAALVLNSAGMFISGTQIYSSGRGFVNELSTSVNSNVLTEVNAGGREAAAAQSGIDKGGRKTDFYVTPSGEAVPATGYRYMPRNAEYMSELKETMTIPSNTNGTYISFDRFDTPNPQKLQVPHDASIRGKFDTLQIIDDVRIPNGKWGAASWKEPITKDFPDYGQGGATQAITNQNIILDELEDLLH